MRNSSSNNFICNVDAELVEVMLDVKEVTVLVSTALFSGISMSLVSKKPSWIGSRDSRRKGEWRRGFKSLNKLEQLEICLWGLRKKGDEEYLRMALKRMHA
ncbi:hypothetical protein RHMOL_Rhmol07G0320300 [Rhododendron molle]|uniref:Uncharacterized protein n=1 Tax=Rhododendron molle TaxID=49168 RepID=A0ACC0N6S3_RHOML|nr:hypothetical protein RHMOL_Rhmol07G0320300 [Rhododendron molle]